MRSLRKIGDPAEDVLAFLEWRGDGVSFAELMRFLPELKGAHVFGPPENPSIIYWTGVSEAACQAFRRLVDEGRIALDPVNPLFYALDGFVSPHPIARGNRRYRDVHWAPVRLSRAPRELARQARAAAKPRAG